MEDSTFTLRTVVVKADKVSKNAAAKSIAAIKRKLGVQEMDVLPYSSVKNQGRDELLEVIAGCLTDDGDEIGQEEMSDKSE